MTDLESLKLKHRIYDRFCHAQYRRTHHRINRASALKLWDDATSRAAQVEARYELLKAAAVRVAEREQRQRQQVIIFRQYAQQLMLGAAVDAEYAPMLAPQQNHEAATITALADATRAARNEARR